MKKLLLAVWLAVKLAFAVYVNATDITVAPSAFTISAPTTTTLTLDWTLGATGCDSVNIIRISGSDTLFSFGDMSNTQTETTLVGLVPATQYILGLRVRRGDSTAVSNLDTMYTDKPAVERSSIIDKSTIMYGARSRRAAGVWYDSLYVSTSSGLDSTISYWAKAYTAIQVKAIGHADSCKALLYVFGGHAEETRGFLSGDNNTGAFDYGDAYEDTLNITRAGWTPIKSLDLGACDHFYIRADGQTDCANALKLIVRLYRRDD